MVTIVEDCFYFKCYGIKVLDSIQNEKVLKKITDKTNIGGFEEIAWR